MTRPALIALTCVTGLVASCALYVPEEEVSRADIIHLSALLPETGLIADGQQALTLQIDVDAATSTSKAITVTTSDGIVDFAAPPGDAAARTVTVQVAPGGDDPDNARKLVDVPMVVGRNPGAVLVTATLEGVRHQVALTLDPALPDVVVLQTNVTALGLDGASRADLSATLLRDTGQVSLGTRMAWQTCCEGDQQRLAPCPRTPLRVPSLGELQTGDTVAVTAVSERLTAADFGGNDTPFDVFVVAAPVTDVTPPSLCTGPIADADTVRIQVAPLP